MDNEKLKEAVDCVYNELSSLNSKDFQKLLNYGGGTKTGYRKWYNPIRYIKGIFYVKYIPPEKIYR